MKTVFNACLTSFEMPILYLFHKCVRWWNAFICGKFKHVTFKINFCAPIYDIYVQCTYNSIPYNIAYWWSCLVAIDFSCLTWISIFLVVVILFFFTFYSLIKALSAEYRMCFSVHFNLGLLHICQLNRQHNFDACFKSFCSIILFFFFSNFFHTLFLNDDSIYGDLSRSAFCNFSISVPKALSIK